MYMYIYNKSLQCKVVTIPKEAEIDNNMWPLYGVGTTFLSNNTPDSLQLLEISVWVIYQIIFCGIQSVIHVCQTQRSSSYMGYFPSFYMQSMLFVIHALNPMLV